MRGALPWFARLLRRWRRVTCLVLLLLVGAVVASLLAPPIWGCYHWRAARADLKLSRLADARAHVKQCLRVWPHSFDTHLLAARLARRLDDFEGAERHLARCQEIRGGVPEEVILEQALIRAQRGEMDAMMPYLHALVDQGHPDAPLILEAMARGYVRAFRYADAAAVLAEWLAREPDCIQALLLRGWVHEQHGPHHLAPDDYRRVVELDPDNYEGRMQLAALLLDQALPAEALGHLDYLSRKRPGDPEILTRLARCQIALGREDEAQQVFQGVLANNSRFRPALCARGELALQAARPQEAEQCFREALALDAADYQAQFNLCKSLRQQGKDGEARAAEERMRVMEVDLARLRDIVKYEIARSPRDPALLTEVGTLLLRGGSAREGLQWLHSALRNDPGYRPAHRALYAHYERVGDTQKAAAHRRFLGGEEQAGGPGR